MLNATEDGETILEKSKSSVGVKCAGMAIMFAVPFIFGVLPIRFRKMKNTARFTSIASCFGGGVFFGTCFMHLVPEVAYEFEIWKRSKDSPFLSALPLAEMLECVGFVLILLVEVISNQGGHGHSHNHEPIPTEEVEDESPTKNGSLRLGDESPVPPASPNESQIKKGVGVLIFALLIHSIFEGLAIGVEARSSVFMQLAGAILIHKCVVAFALGSRLTEATQQMRSVVIHMCVFCIGTPLGIAVAIGILEGMASLDPVTVALVSGIIQGLSTGFFLYITFAEMIFDEMRNNRDLLLKVLFLGIGCSIIGASTIIHNYSEAKAGLLTKNP